MNVTGGRPDSPLHLISAVKMSASIFGYEENALWSEQRYPEFTSRERPKLAVVGGGHSAAEHIDELKAWDGDVWAIKGTVRWLFDHGIKSTLVSCHPYYDDDWANCADRALLSSACPKGLFESLRCPIEIFHTDVKRERMIVGGCTTLAKTPHLALLMGYREVHFFGADSSADGASHTYQDKSSVRLNIVCDGREFSAQPDWVWQAEHMQQLFEAGPRVYKNRSGGLMEAMIKTKGQYDVRL